MNKCQSVNAKIDHSDDVAYFTVTTLHNNGELRTRTECLSHAARSEQRGFKVELIDER